MFSNLKQSVSLAFIFSLLLGCGNDQGVSQQLIDFENRQQQTPDNTQEPPAKEDLPPVEKEPEIPNPNKNPANTAEFLSLPNGKKLSSIKVRGSSLRLIKGTGQSFSENRMREYLSLKDETQKSYRHKVQWTFMNLDTKTVIDRSSFAHKKIFGASSSKIYVGAALLNKQEGSLSSSQMQKMADMIVVSSNSAWTDLQRQIGNGSANKGREYIHNFTQDMGYTLTRGFQGYWGSVHGNELTPDECVDTLYDIYQNNFPGAEVLWKIMYTSRTGTNRGKKYIPNSIFVGGKTGTYSGPTEDPETGNSYRVNMKNHLMVFNINGVQYGLAILANNGSDQSVSLLAGGLIREYTDL